ncbi:MAG: spinster family MFS transporter [Maricaulaceae bacterium]
MTELVSPRPPSADAEPSEAYRAWVLFILVVVYAFNFIDRQIVGILAIPIKADLGLSDLQLSLMGGLAFALIYSFLGIPVAWLADRTSRSWIMTAALAIWSAMTMACGLAQNFIHLFLARLGVGIGEAGGVAPAYALVADYFPPKRRARALALYSLGIPIGSALGVVLGGVLNEWLGWRQAFLIVGGLGLLLAPIFRLTLREPQRGRYDGAAAALKPAPIGDVFKALSRKRSFWMLTFGAASSSMMGYGLIFWLPCFFVRSFGDELPGFFAWLPSFLVPESAGATFYAGYFFGSILLVGGVIGIAAGGWLADWLGPKDRAYYARLPAWAFATSLPFFFLGVLGDTLWVTFLAFMVIQAMVLVWLGPVLTAFQHLVTPNMRATASAVFLFVNNLVGIGLGNLIIGGLSDFLAGRLGEESLRYAIVSGSVFYVIAAALFFLVAPRLRDDWIG